MDKTRYDKLIANYEAKKKAADISNADPLSVLAFKYDTDKCPQIKHPFTPFYFKLLNDKRKSIKKVLEIGVGYREMDWWRSYNTGASLLMWREFFPNAQIYGIDTHPSAIFSDIRINTFLFDQTKKDDLQNLINEIGSDIDLVIDDGSHKTEDQIFTCQTLMPMMKKDVIYIIEDVKEPEIVVAGLNIYDCQIPDLRRKFKDDNLVVVTNMASNSIDPLSKLAFKYKTDKCPQIKHSYTPIYYELLKDKRESIKKVLEIGIGTGASLLMWQEFFPNAQIYGIDIFPEAIYSGERIKSYLYDQSKESDLLELIRNIGSDIDLIIDDGSHRRVDQVFTCKTLMPLVKKDIIYVIEDAPNSRKVAEALSEYNCFIPDIKSIYRDDKLVIIRAK